MRRAEHADVDLHERTVRVHRTRAKVKGGWEVHTSKSGKGRRTPLPRALADDLRAYLAQHPHADDLEAPLWPGPEDHRALYGRHHVGPEVDRRARE